MDAPQLAEFETRLRKRRAELLAISESAAQAAATVELDQSRVGRLSRMDALQGQAMSVEGKRRQEQELRRVDAALVRLKRREFGDCLECAEPINPQRLQLDPSTPYCIRCAQEKERVSGQ